LVLAAARLRRYPAKSVIYRQADPAEHVLSLRRAEPVIFMRPATKKAHSSMASSGLCVWLGGNATEDARVPRRRGSGTGQRGLCLG
jgi:hypothetical protein